MKYCRFLCAALVSSFAGLSVAETIHGVLIDPSGKPIRGAWLEGYAVDRGGARQSQFTALKACSDARGSFRLDNLPSSPSLGNPIHLIARLPNGHFANIAIGSDNEKLVVDDRPMRLQIRVTDTKGTPFRGALVGLESVYAMTKAQPGQAVSFGGAVREIQPPITVTTDASGLAVIDGLPAGDRIGYSVQMPGMVRLERVAILASSGDAKDSATMSKAVVLKGAVLSMGKPVRGAKVVATLGGDMGGGRWTAMTGPDGKYVIDDAPSGTLRLSVEPGASNSEYLAKSYQEFNIPEGAERDDFNFELQKGILLTGHVKTETGGKPVVGATVYIGSNSGGSSMAQTDKNGQFSGRILAGQGFASITEIAGRRTGGNYVIRVVADEQHNPPLEFRIPDLLTFPPIPHLSGAVVDADGHSVPGATVRDLKLEIDTKTDESGHFRFATKTDPGDLIVAEKGDAISKQAVELADKATVNLLLDAKASTIGGQVVGEDGSPMPGVDLTLGGSQGKVFFNFPSVKTDAQGRYSFSGLYGGLDSFFVWAKKPGFGSTTIQPIRISPGESKTLASMKMAAADGVIAGTVLEPDGKPAAGVTVSSQTQESVPVVSDELGHFHLANVPRGDHYLVAGRNNMLGSGTAAKTGDLYVVIKLSPPVKDVPGVVSQDLTGQPAPSLKVSHWINGQPLDLKALRGKIVVLDFWGVWCRPCVDALPQVQALADNYGKEGVTVIGVHCMDPSVEKVKAFVKQKHLTYSICMDQEDPASLGSTAAAYSPQGFPTVFVIDSTGKIVSVSNDVVDAERAIKKLLAKGR